MHALKLSAVALFCVLICSRGSAGAADVPLLDFTENQGTTGTVSNFTIGFSFTLSETITVSSLMFWDEGDNGLSVAHDVGLWNGDGTTLIASATVAAGGSAPAIESASGLGSWRYQSVTPFQLTAGNYVVGAFYPSGNSDLSRHGMTSLSMVSGATYGQSALGSSTPPPSLVFPGSFGSPANGLFGGNVGVQVVPEPTGLLLASIASGVVVLVRKRRGR